MRQSKHKKWLISDSSQAYLKAESECLIDSLRLLAGPTVLKMGDFFTESFIEKLDFPQLIHVLDDPTSTNAYRVSDEQIVYADPAFLPMSPEVASAVLLPHVLEGNELPHQVLREAWHVLMPDGHVVITGFNPFSLLGLQAKITPKTSTQESYYSINRVKEWLSLLGFDVQASAMFHYTPLLKTSCLDFLNSAGDRWLPMAGGGYMIVAKKRQLGMTLVGKESKSKMKFVKPKRRAVASARMTEQREK